MHKQPHSSVTYHRAHIYKEGSQYNTLISDFGIWHPVPKHIRCLPRKEWGCDLPETPPNTTLDCMFQVFLV